MSNFFAIGEFAAPYTSKLSWNARRLLAKAAAYSLAFLPSEEKIKRKKTADEEKQSDEPEGTVPELQTC